MNGVGQRLAEISGAECIVSNGCCAGVTACTLASIAGFNLERMQKIPDLTGLKDEVVIPHSRNAHDHAVRIGGVKIVELKLTFRIADDFQRADGDGLHSWRSGR